jgi:Iap family predicted aminopeptidase
LGLLAGFSGINDSPTLLLSSFGFVYLVAIVMVASWSLGRFVPGANDNASGVAGLVILANRWTHFHHDGTELVVLFSGCEESGMSGAAAWARRHREELSKAPTVFLNLDTIGCRQLHFLKNECALHGLFLEYPEALLELCRSIAIEMGLEFTQPHPIPTHTDGLALLVRGLPGVTITSCGEDLLIPNYHLMSDRGSDLDFDAVYRAIEFAWRLLRELEDYGLAEDIQAGETLPGEPSYSPIAMLESR